MAKNYNPYLVAFAQEILGLPIRTPEFPQFTGAVGAALFAMADAQNASLRGNHDPKSF